MINYCGTCPHNGNAILTSYPPKIRCELTGKLHYTTDACGVDMVAVVRCKDCIHSGQCTKEIVMKMRVGSYLYCPMGNEGFCSHGERKEDAEID